ncbi:MAG: TIGR03560 family F420-dependent LLM class oxidoreductase [Acidimicrobiia bacterium]
MRFSFKVWSVDTDWSTIRRVWTRADRQGIWHGLWINDHLYPPRSKPTGAILDAWTLLAGAATVTERLRIGPMVTANTFRHPAVLAKMAVTVDRISDGRLDLGIGAGWLESEHHAFGIEYGSGADRFARLEETFEVVHGLMTSDRFSYAGRYVAIQDAAFEPKPVQQPRPPFVVGGAGPRRTIPLAARWADHWNYPDYDFEPEQFTAAKVLLQNECRANGRDPAGVHNSVQFRTSGDPAEVVDRAHAYREAGADEIVVSFFPPLDESSPEQVAEALGGM